MTPPSTEAPYLFVPGWGGSGPTHWQTLWTRELGGVGVELADWLDPRRDVWLAALDDATAELRRRDPRPPIVVAHSLGCIVTAEWVRRRRASVRAALLVAPADVDCVARRSPLHGFAPLPRQPLPFASLVVTSDDDPYIALPRARDLATAWGSRLAVIHAGGHLNAESGLAGWTQGRRLLTGLCRADAVDPVAAR